MYCVVCEIRRCRCQQLTALSISTALVTKLLVIEHVLHTALKFAVSGPSSSSSSTNFIATQVLKQNFRAAKGPMTYFPALPLPATNPGDATVYYSKNMAAVEHQYRTVWVSIVNT